MTISITDLLNGALNAKYLGMQTCSSPRVPVVQEGNHMEWRLQNGPICVLEPILK